MNQPLPLNQLAFSVIDIRLTERWWREGLGFLPAGGSRLLMRGPLMGAIQGVPGAATTCWCLLGRNDWAQIEMFQYEQPASKLMAPDANPSDIGYTRCGVWVADLDQALARLAKLGTHPLTAPIGYPGLRRVCVRNPDGVFVELMEDDPLPAQNALGRLDCPVAIRSVTLSTPDRHKTAEFLTSGLGMQPAEIALHKDAHEALWGLADAACERQVFIDGSGQHSILLEVVEYQKPRGKPRAADYSVSDQGILNICFGDPHSRAGVNAMHEQALAAGATHNCRPIHLPMAGCVYVNDPLGFSYEFMWASPGRGHRDYGFTVLPAEQRPLPDNQRILASALIPAAPAEVFKLVNDNAALTDWSGLGRFTPVSSDAGSSGVGALRNVATPMGTMREQITEWQPDSRVRYRIIDSRLLINHQGEITLSPEAGGTRVNWSVRFRSGIPGLGGLLQSVMQGKFDKALKGLQQHARRA